MARVTDAPTHFACAWYTKLTSIFIGDSKPANRYSGKVKTSDLRFPSRPAKAGRDAGCSPRRCDADAKPFAYFNKDGRSCATRAIRLRRAIALAYDGSKPADITMLAP